MLAGTSLAANRKRFILFFLRFAVAILVLTATVMTAQEQPPRIQVPERVQMALLLSSTPAVYPPLANSAGIEGTVRLQIVVAANGSVKEVNVVGGHPLLVQSALDSVRSYRFKPTLLNGVPAEVATSVRVMFFRPGNGPGPILESRRDKVQKKPRDWKARADLGHWLLEFGHVEESLVEYHEAVALAPSEPDPRFGLALVLAEKGDWDGAAKECREALRLDSKNNLTNKIRREQLASWLERKGDFEGAVAAYQELIRLEPKHGVYHYNLALLFGRHGKHNDALVHYREAAKHVGNDIPDFNYRFAKALESAGDVQAAREQYKAACKGNGHRKSEPACERLRALGQLSP